MTTPSKHPITLDRRSAGVFLSLLVLGAGACRQAGKKSQAPRGEAWAAALDAKLSAQGSRPFAIRDRALLSSAFLPRSNRSDRYAQLRAQGPKDTLAAYAMAVRARRNQDAEDLFLASKTLLALEAQQGSKRAAHYLANPVTGQVLRSWWALIQDTPKLQSRIDALWTEYKDVELSPLTRRALLSVVGKSRRMRGLPFRAMYQEQGCVQDWRVGPVQGSLGNLSLGRAKIDPLKELPKTSDAKVFGLACATRVWNPTQEAGFVQLERDLRSSQSGIYLSLSSPSATRVFLDGQEIWRNDGRAQLSSRDAELFVDAKPGRHRLRIALAVPGDNKWLLIRATDAQGRALDQLPAQGPAPQSSVRKVTRLDDTLPQACRKQLQLASLSDPYLAQPWIAYCAMDHALAQYDREAAFVATPDLRKFENFAEGVALLADADLQNAELSKNASRSAAHEALERAVKLDPSLLGLKLALANSRSARGEEGQVREELKHWPAPTHVADALFRFGVYLEVGDEFQADRMLELAQTLAPEHCEVVAAQFRRARDLDARSQQVELLPRLAHCPGSRSLALRFWMNRGNYAAARAIVDPLLLERADDVDDLFRRAEIAQYQGDWAAAKKDLERILALHTASLRAHILLADKSRSEGNLQVVRERFAQLVERFPSENHLRRYLEALGTPDPLLGQRVDGLSLIEADRKQTTRPFPDASSVYLLDRDYVDVYENGTQRHLVHQVVRVQSKEGIDAIGEVKVPEGAELLQLRTVKKDGRRIEPERTDGKAAYSMRALEPGDYVEVEWIMPASWAQAKQGSTDLGVFRFASTRAPFVRSELVVRAPTVMALQIEATNGAPSPSVQKDGPHTTWSFVARDMPRVVPEPASPSLQDLIPQVRCFAKLSSAQWIDELRATTLGSRRRGPTLRAELASWIDGLKSEREKVDAIYEQVHDRIEPEGNLGRDVNRTLSEGKGNRTNLLYALLQEAKVPVRILVARSRFSPRLSSGSFAHPQFSTYDTPVLELWPDKPGQRRYLFAELPFAPIGYLPSWFEGAQAYPLSLQSDEAVNSTVTLGQGLPAHSDRRDFNLDIKLDEEGRARVLGTLKLYGIYAAQWRQGLKRTDPERFKEVFSQYELPRFFVGQSPKVESLKIEHQSDRQKPLVMKFELTVPHLAKKDSAQLSLSSFFMHLNPGAALASLAQRKLDLLVSVANRQKGSIEVTLPQSMRWKPGTAASLQQKVSGPFGRFEQKAQVSGRKLALEVTTQLTPQVVKADRYPEFVEFVRAVSQAQVRRLEASGLSQAR